MRRKTPFADDCDVSSWPPLYRLYVIRMQHRLDHIIYPMVGGLRPIPERSAGREKALNAAYVESSKALDLTMREAATDGRISGILVTSTAEQGKPQEVQHSTSQLTETGTNCPCEPRCASESRS